jgi:mRNA interferase HigB
MQIQGVHLLRDFSKKHSNAKKPLRRWVTIVETSDWKTPADIKTAYASVSFVNTTTVFNIAGNNFRLLSHVLFDKGTVVVYKIVTHAEYDKLTIKVSK